MSRPNLTLLALSAVLAAPSAFGQQLLDDFSGGDDSLWTREDTFAAQALGETKYDAAFDSYTMISPKVDVAHQVYAGSSYTSSIADAKYGNGELEFSVGSVVPDGRAVAFVRGDAGFQNGYAFAMSYRTGTLAIERVDAGVPTVLATKAFALQGEKQYRVRVVFLSDQLSMRVWPIAAPAPVEPQVTALDGLHSGHRLSLGVGNEPGQNTQMLASFDDVEFLVCGSATPYGAGCVASNGLAPTLSLGGCVAADQWIGLVVEDGVPGATGYLLIGTQTASLDAGGGCSLLVNAPGGPLAIGPFTLDAFLGRAVFSAQIPSQAATVTLDVQAWILDPAATIGAAASHGLEIAVH